MGATVEKPQPLATPADVAEYLQVPAGTLEQWRCRGQGPRYSRLGKHVRYAWADVLAYANEQKRGGDAT